MPEGTLSDEELTPGLDLELSGPEGEGDHFNPTNREVDLDLDLELGLDGEQSPEHIDL